MSGKGSDAKLVPLLAGVVAAMLAALAVGIGRYGGADGVRLAAVVTIAAIGLLAGAAVRCDRLRRAREREQGNLEIAARLDRLGADAAIPPAPSREVRPLDALAYIDAASNEVRRLREIAEGVYGLEALFDVAGRLVWISPSIHRITGRTPEECLGAPDAIVFLVHESDRNYCLRMARKVAEGGPPANFEMRLMRADGRICWVACHWRRLGDDSTHPAGLRMSAEDIQARKETEYKLLETVTELRRAQALRERYLARSNDERQRLSALLNVIRLGILFMDRDHRVLYYNRAMLSIWGFAPDENLIGMRDVVLQSRVAALLEQPEAYFEHIAGVLQMHGVSEAHEISLRDGRIVTDVSTVVESAEGQRWIGRVWIYEDVTEERKIARKMVELAERDPLTNLFNRRRFHEELNRLLAEATRHEVHVGLLAIDLDGFKPINDEFGHQAGDAVLVGLAQAVGGVIRRNEMFFRLGGDEFGVLVPDAEERDLCELARRILEVIDTQRFEFEGRSTSLTASLGIALFPQHADNPEQLIAVADQAMYCSKNRGRDRWTLAGSEAHESDRMASSESDEPICRGD